MSFRIGDCCAGSFSYSSGPKEGAPGASLKGRLLYIDWIKVDGENVYEAKPRDAALLYPGFTTFLFAHPSGHHPWTGAWSTCTCGDGPARKRSATRRSWSASSITATAGQAVGSLAMYPAIDSVRQAAPMVLAFLMMAFIICIPIVLVLGTYDLKVAMTLTFAQFALIFVDFWLQLARWVDSTILDALYGNIMGASPHLNFNIMMGVNNAQGDLLLDFVMGTMFLVLPAFWITALSWSGHRLGTLLGGFAEGAGAAKAESGAGGKMALKAGTGGSIN